ncbi:MAG TPA: hypothetical protein ENL34_04770 [Chloroflexi bacterium]|nr:hypothetical protein [Chloroflexota bacterium]
MAINSEQPPNPYQICMWESTSQCKECSLNDKLKCRFKLADLMHFIAMFTGFALPATIGVIHSSYGWYLLGWLAFALFFFQVWESRILCSHCPYYAEKSRILHCIANYGVMKLWHYRPAPMSQAEKIQLWIGFAILMGYPFPFMILGHQFSWAIVAFWAAVLFFWTLWKDTCARCVNFSCPLNHVPQDIIETYLERNPTIRRAWKGDSRRQE